MRFSYLNIIKKKEGERLQRVEEELRICLSHIHSHFTAVIKQHQAQQSTLECIQ